MFGQDANPTIRRMAPLLQRVLIVDSQPDSARMISELMNAVSRPQVWTAPSNDRALKLVGKVEPQLIFAELEGAAVDGVGLTRRLRRSDLRGRQTPVILVTGQATAGSILAARDSGVHEFLRKPFTIKDLLRRLEAITLRPRDWIEAVDYVGPDRRRFNSGDYRGALKRVSDQAATSEQARIGQALKILRSAMGSLEKDPAQARRALLAQTSTLQSAGGSTGDARLVAASRGLHAYLLETAAVGGQIRRTEVEPLAAELMVYPIPESPGRAAA